MIAVGDLFRKILRAQWHIRSTAYCIISSGQLQQTLLLTRSLIPPGSHHFLLIATMLTWDFLFSIYLPAPVLTLLLAFKLKVILSIWPIYFQILHLMLFVSCSYIVVL
ncbi:hypothetical protein CEXT_322731 [Caerostris extrusa]|uniref:Uncharacterized protein n=1 Tax=Caerostris extrusa TaxID=172846 RepID=A0AAV4MV53_CAEEX|nr:hypothetical protein CEXT_322731 [Caerostris extrusa]